MKKQKTKQDEEKPMKTNRKMLTLFLIIFPSIIIAGNYGSFVTNLAIKTALIFYQFVLLKSFLENYYKLIE